MFWTAFVWGLGVTAGGSIGLLGFFAAFWGALDRRNDLTEDQIQMIERLAHATEILAEKTP